MEFLVREFGPDSRQADAGRNAWLYEQNPSLGEAGPGIWICRKSGAIVGYESEIPFELKVGGEQRRAAWAIDLQVREEWRLAGIGPGLIASQLRDRSIAGVLNLSEQGYAAYTRLGWTDLGVVPVYVRPLDARRVLRAPRSPVPARLRRLAPIAGPVLQAADAGLRLGLRLGLRARDARLVAVDRLDERVDQVWAAAASHYPVLARRGLVDLAWRIDARPDADRLQRYLLLRGSRAIGYAVLRPAVSSGPPPDSGPGSGSADGSGSGSGSADGSLSPSADESGPADSSGSGPADDSGSPSGSGPAEGFPAMVVVDYLAPPTWVAPLLLLAGWQARRQGAAALVVRARNEPADRYLRAAGFVRRESVNDPPIRFMVNCADEPDVCARVSDPDAWFVTSADCDLDHAVLAPEHAAPQIE